MLNTWLIELCSAGVLPEGWLIPITKWINHLLVLAGYSPLVWG